MTVIQSANGAFYFDGEAEAMVRAVLGAMRESSDGVLEAGAIMREDGYLLAKWRFMIDTLLEEGD